MRPLDKGIAKRRDGQPVQDPARAAARANIVKAWRHELHKAEEKRKVLLSSPIASCIPSHSHPKPNLQVLAKAAHNAARGDRSGESLPLLGLFRREATHGYASVGALRVSRFVSTRSLCATRRL